VNRSLYPGDVVSLATGPAAYAVIISDVSLNLTSPVVLVALLLRTPDAADIQGGGFAIAEPVQMNIVPLRSTFMHQNQIDQVLGRASPIASVECAIEIVMSALPELPLS
jgi:hypothetical protein